MKHLRLTRDLATALADLAEELGVSQQEVMRRVFRRALDGELIPARYVPGSTYGVAPMALHPGTMALADELTREARNPGYELRRWLAAGLAASRRLDGNAGAYPRTPSRRLDGTAGAYPRTPSGTLDGNAGEYPRTPSGTPGVGMRLDAAVRRQERRRLAVADMARTAAAGVAVLAVFGACTLLGLAGTLMTAADF